MALLNKLIKNYCKQRAIIKWNMTLCFNFYLAKIEKAYWIKVNTGATNTIMGELVSSCDLDKYVTLLSL